MCEEKARGRTWGQCITLNEVDFFFKEKIYFSYYLHTKNYLHISVIIIRWIVIF